ncbi:pseudouridine synthase [Synergistales bacterium]|nr:pseudouridine synthase [Synergistales bacterium]
MFRVTADQADRRLDRVLRSMYGDVPLSAIMKAIRKGAVRVNGGRKDGSYRLAELDEVFVPWQDGEQEKAPPVKGRAIPAKLEALLKTNDLWCVDKPAGLLSQPDTKGGDSVITRAWATLKWDREDFKPAIVNRLDRNVSGVTVIALSYPTLRTLSALIRDREVRKIYRAIVSGHPQSCGEIDIPILKDERKNKVTASEEGLPALSRYKLLKSRRDYSLVEIELVTGRPHQARFHMASIGYPVLGDLKYGPADNYRRGEKRIFLHAYSLTFPDASELTDDIRGVTITSPMPDVFNRFDNAG